MLMKLSLSLFLPLCLSLSLSPHAFAGTVGGQIECLEQATEDVGVDVGSIKITLGSDGKAESILIKRAKTESSEAFELNLDQKNAQITHEVGEGVVTDIDEETKKPIYNWGIPKIETIEAKSDRVSFSLKINDHLYSGWPGSHADYEVDGKKSDSTLHILSCKGQLKFPMSKY